MSRRVPGFVGSFASQIIVLAKVHASKRSGWIGLFQKLMSQNSPVSFSRHQLLTGVSLCHNGAGDERGHEIRNAAAFFRSRFLGCRFCS